MKIHTLKIKQELKRNKWTLEDLGREMKPKQSRQAVWYAIKSGKTFRSIEAIARALKLDPKDLIR
jgi:hypothetical protein